MIGVLFGATIVLLSLPWKNTKIGTETIVLATMAILITVYFLESSRSPIFWRIRETKKQ